MILAIDTSGSRCGVALISKTTQVFCKDLPSFLRHNEYLLQEVHQLLQAHQVAVRDLQAVAVSCGPGSFTGLRIGMAVAKGLCWSWRLPLICVPTLDAIANAIPPHEGVALVPLIPARAEEVYWNIYEDIDGRGWQAKTSCRVDAVAALPELIPGSVAFCGEGMQRHRTRIKELFKSRLISPAEKAAEDSIMPSLSRLAAARFKANQFEDLYSAEPSYYYPFLRQDRTNSASGG